MEEQDKKIPFPQANDFTRILKILEADEEDLVDKNYLLELLELGTYRQVQYYISACQFLGLLDGDCKFTRIALKIRKSCYDNKIMSLSRLIISMPVFGETFFKKYIYNEDSTNDEIAQLINDLWSYKDSFAVCYRRASTVKQWLEWIEKNRE